jgi:hypothetical protein
MRAVAISNHLVICRHRSLKFLRVKGIDRINIIDETASRVGTRVTNEPLDVAVVFHKNIAGNGQIHL